MNIDGVDYEVSSYGSPLPDDSRHATLRIKEEEKRMKVMQDLLVRRVYTHNGISVVVQLDFQKETISLVDKDGTFKKWIFSDRTPDYIAGWTRVLEAMQHAINQAYEEMRMFQAEKTKDFAELLIAISKESLDEDIEF